MNVMETLNFAFVFQNSLLTGIRNPNVFVSGFKTNSLSGP